MKEDFLHYLWKFKKFEFLHAKTITGESLEIDRVGLHNQTQSGPDFFNAKIKIGNQLWAGNVEIHKKSSDWYAHHHQTDPAYDNVILHVVWEHDVEVFRKDSSPIPTLTLKEIAHQNALDNYNNLLGVQASRWINCEPDFPDFDDFEMENWLERLYIERLENKSKVIDNILKQNANDWEATLFCMLAKNFGLNVNGDAFLSIAQSIPFSKIRKIEDNLQLEALLLGQAGLLHKPYDHPYFKKLKSEYTYLKHKFNLNAKGVLPISFFRLRPQNFPTIRLAQLAALYTAHQKLFHELIEREEVKKIKELFSVKASAFWDTHFTFENEVKPRAKKISKSFIDLVLINTVVPLKFSYARHNGGINHEALFAFMRQLPQEKNSITKGFNKLRPKTAKNAMDSQALIQLKKEYCDKNQCLRCNLGLKLLQK